MWVTIYIPPDSQFNLTFPQIFDQLGFKFDAARIGLVHQDGTFIDGAPGPPQTGQ